MILHNVDKMQKQPFSKGLFLRMCAVSENKTKKRIHRRIPKYRCYAIIMILQNEDKSKIALFFYQESYFACKK